MTHDVRREGESGKYDNNTPESAAQEPARNPEGRRRTLLALGATGAAATLITALVLGRETGPTGDSNKGAGLLHPQELVPSLSRTIEATSEDALPPSREGGSQDPEKLKEYNKILVDKEADPAKINEALAYMINSAVRSGESHKLSDLIVYFDFTTTASTTMSRTSDTITGPEGVIEQINRQFKDAEVQNGSAELIIGPASFGENSGNTRNLITITDASTGKVLNNGDGFMRGVTDKPSVQKKFSNNTTREATINLPEKNILLQAFIDIDNSQDKEKTGKWIIAIASNKKLGLVLN